MLKWGADLLRNRGKQIDKAAGYACGGKIKAHADGGKVKTIKGPGTSTSDSIPAKVKETGEKILVSNGERILSKKQDKLLSRIAQMLGYESTDALLESGTGSGFQIRKMMRRLLAGNGQHRYPSPRPPQPEWTCMVQPLAL